MKPYLGVYIKIKDIIDMEGCKESTAKRRINEARKKLRMPVSGIRSLKGQKVKTLDYCQVMGITVEDLRLIFSNI